MSILNKLVTRVFYYPSVGYIAALRRVGVWRKWDRVDERVLLGGVPSRADVRTLAGLGVTAIINMCEEFNGHLEQMSALGIEQLHLPTLDFHCPAPDALVRGVEFLLERRAESRQIYVHCKVVRARSEVVSAGLAAVGGPLSRLQPSVLALNTQLGGSQVYVRPAG